MNSFALECFQAMAGAAPGQDPVNLALMHPVVLSESVWPEFRQWAKGQSPEMQNRAEAAMEMLAGLLQEGIKRWHKYPMGPGPLDRILHQAREEEIDAEQAAVAAGSPEIVRDLSPVYVRALLMQFVMEAINGDWRKPLLCHQVIQAALKARRSMLTVDQKVMEAIAAIEYASVAKQALWETADGRFLTDTVGRIEAILDFDPRPWRTRGAAEYAMGQMYLDPYIQGRGSTNFQQQIQVWMRRAYERMGARLTDEMAREMTLPEPLEALTEASRHFLASADLETSTSRGISLKAYIEAEAWKKVAGGTCADIGKLAAEALTLLAGGEYTSVRAAIDSLVLFAGQTIEAPDTTTDWKKIAQDLVANDAGKMVAERGLVQTTELMLRVLEAVASEDAVLASELWRKALPLMLRREETDLNGFLQSGVAYICNGLGDPEMSRWALGSVAAPAPGEAGGPGGTRTPLEAGAEAEQTAQAQHWPAEKLAATLLFFAVRSQPSNREMEGVQLVAMAARLSEELAQEWNPLLSYLSAILYRGEASNQFAAKDYTESMRYYAYTAVCFLEAHLPGRAMEALEYGAGLVTRLLSPVGAFAVFFSAAAPELERQGGNGVVARIRDLGRSFMVLAAKDGHFRPEILLLLGILKGALLDAARRTGGQLEWLDSEESRQALSRIEEARRAAPGGGILQDIGGLDMDDLLTVFAEETEMAAGDGPDSVLHNLEVKYDRAVRTRMSRRFPQQEMWLPSLDHVMGALGPETVLLNYYSGPLPNGNAGLYVHILTNEAVTGATIDYNVGLKGQFLGRGKGFEADVFALPVSALRRAMRLDPGTGTVSDEARRLLNSASYTGEPVAGILKKLRDEGKWHLCILPHGPLHFVPFHLLPYGDGLLGDEWAVTCLPAFGLLDRKIAEAPARQRKMASFGIEFKNGVPHGLEEIPGAEEEARAVAAVFGEKALTGGAATETAVHEALSNAQRVHLSTHGLHAVSAPSFQRVYLTPDEQSDGILYGWELLRHDLRGLDLLTLSACETALGRVDKGDNLRSLAANALIAGASTVIGTLWPARSEVTRTFFASFYGEIAGGSGKREAFQTAQLTARQKHPRFQDWGAFWYTGLW